MIRFAFARNLSLVALTACMLGGCAQDVGDESTDSTQSAIESEKMKKLKELAEQLQQQVKDGKATSIGGGAAAAEGSAKGGVAVDDTPVHGIIVTGNGTADVEFIIDKNGDVWIIAGANVKGTLNFAIGGLNLLRLNGDVGAIAVVNISKLKEALETVKQLKELAKKKDQPAPPPPAPATPPPSGGKDAPAAPATPGTPPKGME